MRRILVGVNPALDAFTDMAEHIKSDAELRAQEYGQTVANPHRAA